MIAQLFSAGLFLWGLWIACTGEARFDIGGSETGTARYIRVNAQGLDAIAIGVFIMGVGLLGIGERMPSKGRARRPVLAAGLAMVAVPLVYGLALGALAVVRLLEIVD